MKTWYKAVCDQHKEACDIFVTNPLCTYGYLKDNSKDIQAWLELHYGCNLRLVHHDEDLDFLFDNKYTIIDDGWR
jgi:hypothetical protein